MPKNTKDPSPLFTSQDLKDYRKSISLSQRKIGIEFSIPLGTIRNWEQNLAIPNISAEKLRLINNVLSWKQKRTEDTLKVIDEKRQRRSMLKLKPNSQLVFKVGDTLGTYCDRLGNSASALMKRNSTSRYAMQRLAYIAHNLPSDYHPNRKDILRGVKQHLRTVDDKMKQVFKCTYLAHSKGGNEDRLSWLLSK